MKIPAGLLIQQLVRANKLPIPENIFTLPCFFIQVRHRPLCSAREAYAIGTETGIKFINHLTSKALLQQNDLRAGGWFSYYNTGNAYHHKQGSL